MPSRSSILFYCREVVIRLAVAFTPRAFRCFASPSFFLRFDLRCPKGAFWLPGKKKQRKSAASKQCIDGATTWGACQQSLHDRRESVLIRSGSLNDHRSFCCGRAYLCAHISPCFFLLLTPALFSVRRVSYLFVPQILPRQKKSVNSLETGFAISRYSVTLQCKRKRGCECQQLPYFPAMVLKVDLLGCAHHIYACEQYRNCFFFFFFFRIVHYDET